MESEPKPQRVQRNKRRERAHQLQQEKHGAPPDGSGDEGDESPPRTSKDKGRGKPRRRRNSSIEEDIIDGFAIVSFKSLEELENSIKNTNGIRQPKNEKQNSQNSSPAKEKKQTKKRLSKKDFKNLKNCSSAASPNSDHPSQNLDPNRSPAINDTLNHTNGPPRSISRDSDASTHSSSGQGYIPECESGDDKTSESGSDLFTVAVPHSRPPCERLPTSAPLTPSPTPQPTPLCNGTVTPVSTPITTVSVTTATVTSTTCSTPTTSPAGTTTTTCRPSPRPLVSPVTGRHPTPTPPPPPRQSPLTITNHSKAQVLGAPPPVSREPAKFTPPPAKPPRRDSTPHSHLYPHHSQPHPHHSQPHPHHGQPHPQIPHSHSQPHSQSLHPSHHSHHHHHHQQHREREREREKESLRERERERERDLSLHPNNLFPGSLPFSKPPLWSPSAANNHIYSGSSHSLSGHSPSLHSPSLHSLHPSASPLHPTPPHPPHSMFAPPIPPGPPPLTSTALPPVASPASHFASDPVIRNQDFIHQDLNNRLIAANREGSSAPIGASPFLRSETTHHQHQHSHLHNHQHMHQHFNTLGPPPSLVPTPTPHLFDKIPKPYESIYRPNLLPSAYPGFSTFSMPPGPAPSHLSSDLHGAFQPKARSLQPSSVLLPMRDREKPVTPASSLATQKKTGKWCAVHVRVAWEIYHHQQKQQNDPNKSSEVKPGDLRPPSHLLPGSTLHPRPPELPGGAPSSSLLASHPRSILDGVSPHGMSPHGANSFLHPSQHVGVSPFPRPSPFPSSLSFGGLGSLANSPFAAAAAAAGRDLSSVPGMSSPHDWNRLRRTPPSFPSWPKLDLERESDRELEHREREREREQRERERERELSERRREEERRNAESRERLNSLVDMGDRSRDRFREHERRRSRSRSRSPMRNGRVDSAKSDSSSLDRHSIKVKEERRDEESHPMNSHTMNSHTVNSHPMNNHAMNSHSHALSLAEQRDKLLRNSLPVGPMGHLGQMSHIPGLSMYDRSRAVLGPHYFPIDRPPPGQHLWSPFDKGPLGVNPLESYERERQMAALRLPGPPSMALALEQERLKEQIIRDDIEMRRNILERSSIPSTFDRHFDHSKLPLRTPDLGFPPLSSRTISPAINHSHNHSSLHNHHPGSKNASPAMIPGIPPPLIPSASATHSRSRNESPSSSKSKGCSPADSTSEMKDKRDGGSTDPDGHSR